MNQEVTRPDLSREVRFRVPLVFAIPIGALLVIGLLAFGFSQVLLGLESKEAATTIAIVMAANVLAGCAYVALRPRLQRGSIAELMAVALYPVIIGVALAQTGVLAEEADTHAPPAEGETSAPAPAADELVAADIAWNTETLEFKAGETTTLPVDNQDTSVHNMSIYPDEASAEAQSDALFTGPDVAAGATEEYEIDPLKKGTYTFICDYHINMKGEVTVQ